MKMISTGTLPHLSSVHYLRAQVSKNDFDKDINTKEIINTRNRIKKNLEYSL